MSLFVSEYFFFTQFVFFFSSIVALFCLFFILFFSRKIYSFFIIFASRHCVSYTYKSHCLFKPPNKIDMMLIDVKNPSINTCMNPNCSTATAATITITIIKNFQIILCDIIDGFICFCLLVSVWSINFISYIKIPPVHHCTYLA